MFGGGGEREYQWLWKQSPAVRRTLVNVRGVIAVTELLLRDLFSSNQNVFFFFQSSGIEPASQLVSKGSVFTRGVPPESQSVYMLLATVLI